jgi:DNA-binding HxlR family transcriptional regulator
MFSYVPTSPKSISLLGPARIVAARRSNAPAKATASSPEARPITPIVERDFGSLGHAWALTVLRDVAFERRDRFGMILRANPGLTPRVLSKRLSELVREGILDRVTEGRTVRYRLTGKGEDAAFILLALLRFSTRHPKAPA